MTTTEMLRENVRKYIDNADENSLRRVQAILEIDQSGEWWNDDQFVRELDSRYEALESGADKGLTLEQLKVSIENHKQKKRGK